MKPWQRLAIVVVAVPAVVAAASACKELPDEAQAKGAELLGCAAADVVVSPSKLPPSVAFLGAESEPDPSLKQAPGALQAWQAANRQARDLLDRSWKAFDAHGCGGSAIVLCRHGEGRRGGKDLANVRCLGEAEARKLGGD